MTDELSFAYVKAEGIDGECEAAVFEKLGDRGLDIVFVRDIFMNYLKLREHQPILFDVKGDINDVWKIQGSARLIGSTVRGIMVRGEDAVQKTFDTKLEIRERFAVPCEFDREAEMSYPNFMHAADDRAQVENDVKVLAPDKLAYVKSVNGDNKLTSKIW